MLETCPGSRNVSSIEPGARAPAAPRVAYRGGGVHIPALARVALHRSARLALLRALPRVGEAARARLGARELRGGDGAARVPRGLDAGDVPRPGARALAPPG